MIMQFLITFSQHYFFGFYQLLMGVVTFFIGTVSSKKKKEKLVWTMLLHVDRFPLFERTHLYLQRSLP